MSCVCTVPNSVRGVCSRCGRPMRQRLLAVLDPAWNTDDGGGGRGAQNHYALSSVDALAAQYRLDPRWNRSSADALVFIWTTRSALREGDAATLVRLLDLRICSDFVWAKIDEVDFETAAPDAVATFSAPAMMGLGFWSRSEHEYLLVCRRGDVEVPLPADRPRSIIYAPRVKRPGADDVANKTVHSAKPEKAWTQVIEPIARSSMPGIVGIEFNARVQRPGWGAVGRLDGEDKPIRYAPAVC